jgi:RNA polymerase sigma factor (sigma-70 family)
LKPTVTYTEDLLVAGLKSHNNDAYEYLYLNYKNALYTVIKQFIADEDISNDVLQDVFVAIWKNIEKYEPSKGRLFTWLHTLTRNTTINTLRSKAYKSEQKNETIENVVSVLDEERNASLNIDSIGLRKQVDQLRTDYKNVISLSYFNGYTQEEIAKILDIPVGTVKTRLRNALIEIRKQFK